MADAAKLGTNFTGVQMSPKDSKKMMEAANHWMPDVPGDRMRMLEERTLRSNEADRIGSVPVPGSAKGMLKSTFDMVRGKSPELLVDKLGERLAYERNGVRLYEAMIAKVGGMEKADPAMVGALQQIRDEEYEHMLTIAHAIESLGADPTAQTPCADVVGVMAMGIVQVLSDPRTNVPQCLNALLTVELADNAAWELLIELSEAAGHKQIADSFVRCKVQEDEHLIKIKSMMRRDLLNDVQ
ncbi:ferritin-like domain-containing protein [Stutzerimonas tarimensis]|uniref:Ferritin-like domain-containing protein n=1 Tax=Stutzerimonas tarimensis TaxID=1507735 RepID=A0ABV7T4H6_9GAMM